MNDELISKQAAIDEVFAWLKDSMSDKKNGKPLTERLKDLPSAQPVDKDINVPINDTISRQAAISLVHKNYDTILDFKSDGRTVADSFEDIINTLPPAQPEIIYCKDCQLRCEDYYTKNIHGTILYYCSQLAQMIETDFYCGYAERRTDAQTD